MKWKVLWIEPGSKNFKNKTHCDMLFRKQMQFMHFLLKFVKIEKGHVNKCMPLEHYSLILELGCASCLKVDRDTITLNLYHIPMSIALKV
jgi:hypothetical protein